MTGPTDPVETLGQTALGKAHPQARLLSYRAFLKCCEERKVAVDLSQLERLAREGLVQPLFHVRRARTLAKRVRVLTEAGVEVETFETLGPDEDPRSATDTIFAAINEDMESFRGLRERGLVIFPGEVPFRPWKEFREGFEEVEIPYYHPLQILMVREAASIGRFSFQDSLLEVNADEVRGRIEIAREMLAKFRQRVAAVVKERERLIRLLLKVEDAFLPRLHLRFVGKVGVEIQQSESEWWEWQRSLDWSEIIKSDGWTTEEIREAYMQWSASAAYLDPMENWYLLARNIRYERRMKLKGDALLAQNLYDVAMMLKWLYENATGSKLPEPDEVLDLTGGKWKTEWYGARDVFEDRKARLKLLTEYGLNPVYSVHLILEGLTEREFTRIVAPALGLDFESLDVHIDDLGGVDKVDPGRIEEMLRHVVDEGGVAYVILDNDQRVTEHIEDLKKTSGPNGRPLLRGEFVTIWKGEFEDDNFTLEEIAAAFNRLAASLGGKLRVSHTELEKIIAEKEAAGAKPRVTKVLKEIVSQRGDFAFDGNRKEFARYLAEIVVTRMEEARSRSLRYEPSTPMEKELQKVARLASALGFGARLE